MRPASGPTHTPTSAAAPKTGELRSVEAIHHSTDFHWVGDGFHVATYFPSPRLPSERTSPFVLMDYGPERDFPALARGKRGVGWHPHRGFETVTLAWQGAVAHQDNAGHKDVIGPGDAQWMTAASGIFHEEYHEEAFTRAGGKMQMMQLWVNLPARDKKAAPGYQALKSADIPVVEIAGGRVRVLAGGFAGARGPAKTFTPITMLDVRLEKGGRLVVDRADLPPSYNAMAVVASGRVKSGIKASAGELILFANDGGGIALVAEEDAHVIVLAGEPIAEPIVQYGPFVMNRVEEIREAVLDLQRGQFGPLPDFD